MFIRQTTTGSVADGTARFTFGLVESQRIDGKVRQHTLLNLGRYFAIDHEEWRLLRRRTEELLSGQTPQRRVGCHYNVTITPDQEARNIARQSG